MRPTLRCTAVLLILTLMGVRSPAQELSKTDESYIDSLMTANYKADEPGAVILIAKNGAPLLRKAYGLASVELAVPNKPEYLFRIGSMSKQFTAVCVLRLAQEGKLSLTDDIRKYLPQYNTHGRTITIQNLLTHTSGIPSYTEKQDFIKKMVLDQSKEELVKTFMDDSLLFKPGSDWSYSNSGFVLAGLIVEKASGTSLDDYLRSTIFTPLGMTRTYIGTYDRIIPGAASGYESAGDKTYVDAPYLSWSWPYAAGAIVSSVDDLLKWDEALYGETIVKQEWLKKAWTSCVLSNGAKANYGFGWGVSDARGIQIIEHGGGINGFVCDGVRIPSRHLYLVILSNNTGKNPGQFAGTIAARLAGVTVPVPLAVKATKEKLQEYAGTYEVRRSGGRRTSNMGKEPIYRYLTVSNDTLFSQQTGGGRSTLLQAGEDLFVVKDSRVYFQFRRDNGKISSLEIHTEPIQLGPTEIEPLTNIPLPGEKKSVALDPKVLSKYKGKYDFGGGFFITVTMDGNRIFAQGTGQPVVEIFPESETRFFLKVVDATIEFTKESGEKVTGLVLTQGGKMEARKVE